jgi:cell wall integrity and stress response component
MWVVLTGNTLNRVDYFKPESSSSSSAKPTSAKATSAAPVQTPTSSPSSAPKQEESKPNTAGIAAGVVVGIVGLTAIIAGVWFFLRRRRQKQAEDDYRRNAHNIDSFVAGGKTSASSMNDSRIDPSFMDRRQSNGSIADNEDYSRRILKVRYTSYRIMPTTTNIALGHQRLSAFLATLGNNLHTFLPLISTVASYDTIYTALYNTSIR